MSAPAPAYVFNALATRVIDGDTFEARLDLGKFAGCKVEATPHLRIRGYSAPELADAGGVQARAKLASLIMFEALIVQTYKASFERTVADVWIKSSGLNVAELMVATP